MHVTAAIFRNAPLSLPRITARRGIRQTKARYFDDTRVRRSITDLDDKVDIASLLSKPTWSVASLLPSQNLSLSSSPPSQEITPEQLRHLLRLSALPPPASHAEEESLLISLHAHLHFVKEIQSVNTAGVEPLQSLRDETKLGEKEAEVGLEALREALQNEEVKGVKLKRIRRKRDAGIKNLAEEWDVLGTAQSTAGRFFVVEGGKDR